MPDLKTADSLTPEYVKAKLMEIMEDPDIKTKDKLLALRMAGEHLKMFQKTVNISITDLVRKIPTADLKRLQDGNTIEMAEVCDSNGDTEPVYEPI